MPAGKMVESERTELSEAEAELYDRQIRLWGLDSQKRLRNARILIIGMRGFGAEIAKNIVLSGVKSVTLLDDQPLNKSDTSAQFLAPPDKIGVNRAEASRDRTQALNPMVQVIVNNTPLSELSESFYNNFEVICATNCSQNDLIKINNISRTSGVKFFCGHVWGMFGYTFADLQIHEYAEDIVQYKAPKRKADENPATKGEAITTTVKQTSTFVPLEAALSVDDSKLQAISKGRRSDPSYFVTRVLLNFRLSYGRDPDIEQKDEDFQKLIQLRDEFVDKFGVSASFVPDEYFNDVFGEVSPACAIVGGVLGQEIIKAVSQKEPPHNNMFFFNPTKCLGLIEKYGE